MEFADFGVEVIEGGAERAGQVVVRGQQRGPLGPQDAQVELGEKKATFRP